MKASDRWKQSRVSQKSVAKCIPITDYLSGKQESRKTFGHLSPRTLSAGRGQQPRQELIDWLAASEHLFGFGQCFERDAIANRKELVPHREHVWILVRSLNCFLRFPFRDFNERAVAGAHNNRRAIGRQTFCAQSRDTVSN